MGYKVSFDEVNQIFADLSSDMIEILKHFEGYAILIRTLSVMTR